LETLPDGYFSAGLRVYLSDVPGAIANVSLREKKIERAVIGSNPAFFAHCRTTHRDILGSLDAQRRARARNHPLFQCNVR
jgi:hypothetical protein